MSFVGKCIVKVNPNTDFRIFIVNVGNINRLTIGQTVSVVAELPASIMDSPINHGEVRGVAVKKLYLKGPCDAKAEEVINRSLAKNQEAKFGESEEKPITAETVPLSVDKNYHAATGKMLKKHESMSYYELGNRNVTTHHIVWDQKQNLNNPKSATTSCWFHRARTICVGFPRSFLARGGWIARFCIDYCTRYKVTIKDSYHIYRMDE